jgi:SAM-dependent methyltransferase
MTGSNEERVKAAISLYTKPLLFFYDSLLLGCNCRCLWKCHSRHLLELYDTHISANHLDIGVGSGYFMDKCRFPSPQPRLGLMDLNPNSLRAASKRLARYNPEAYQRNVLEPFNLQVPSFDSIGMMNLLHCLPGDMKTKAVVFQNALEVLNPGGTVFGSTIMYLGVERNLMTTQILEINNRKGIMTNLEDDVEDLRENLKNLFSESEVKIIGCEALFWGRK